MAETNEFGEFFRGTREGLGLSLREFCRQGGFDQANVSRMERGLLPPPKSKRVLTAYAKALKLKHESQEWERFMTLANPPARPRRGLGHKNWVRARNLEDWAGTLNARETLPQLIRRLIRATGEGIVRLEAPSGEQIQRPEWDGHCEATENNEFVPQGTSVWEMGTDKNPKGKADEDFAKRLKKRAGIVRRETTFTFVTPRKWQKKSEWADSVRKQKTWKDVRVFDSASLEEWIECAPAVDIWLARLLGLCPEGVCDVDEKWKNLQALTDPSLESGVFLASRSVQFEELRKWVEGQPNALLIESRSPAEAVDFVVAASRRPELGEAFAAKAVIVETRNAWRSLVGGDAKLILIAAPTLDIEAELVAEAVRNGHHAMVSSSLPPAMPHMQIVLERVSILDLMKALGAQKVPHKESERLAAASGGSLTVLKRHISRHPGTMHPEWSKSNHARPLVPLLLAGKWDHGREGDRLALEELAGDKYRDVLKRAEQWSSGPDPVFYRTLSQWELISRDDSWNLMSREISDDDLERFEKVVLEVLGEADPSWDLPMDDRWQANALGNSRKYSGLLRTGLAESLALLGARPPLRSHLSRDPSDRAKHLVRSLLHGKDWKTWASLSQHLTLLAEASSDAFLSAIEHDLEKRHGMVKLFEAESPPPFGSSPHAGLLFAFEVLAWDPRSLPRVSRLLARIQQAIGWESRGNSPLRSLVHIFMPWYPQTTVSVEERVKQLEMLTKEYPDAAWKVLLELLKHHHSVDLICRPAFRNWVLDWERNVTRGDAIFQMETCATLMVELAGKNPAKLSEAVRTFDSMPSEGRARLIERIHAIALSEVNVEDRRVLAETIREMVNRHRQFANADWAMKEDLLQKLEKARQHIEPQDVVLQNAWLFGDYWKIRDTIVREKIREASMGGKLSLDVDLDENDITNRLESIRSEALKKVRKEKGWDGVLALAVAAESPGDVGLAVSVSDCDGDEDRILPTLLDCSEKKLAEFAKVYVAARLHTKGPGWPQQLKLGQWSDAQVLELALALGSQRSAWDIVKARGHQIEEQYWRRAGLCYGKEKEAEDVLYAARRIAQAGRPFWAIRQLGFGRNRGVRPEPNVVLEVLESGGEQLIKEGYSQSLSDVHHDIGVLIQELQQRHQAGDTSVDVNRLANVEMIYLDLLDGHPTTAKTLHALLEQSPEFFSGLIQALIPQSQDGGKRELSERERMRAMNVYRLLNSWERVPGLRSDGSVDSVALNDWLKKVRQLGSSESYHTLSELKTGAVFAAFEKKEADGTWPCIPVKDAIEEFGTEALAEGFEVGIMNRRGAYTKAIDEGGGQERNIAEEFRSWAEASRGEWPKTAASLDRIADYYEAYARREDAEAQARLKGL